MNASTQILVLVLLAALLAFAAATVILV